MAPPEIIASWTPDKACVYPSYSSLLLPHGHDSRLAWKVPCGLRAVEGIALPAWRPPRPVRRRCSAPATVLVAAAGASDWKKAGSGAGSGRGLPSLCSQLRVGFGTEGCCLPARGEPLGWRSILVEAVGEDFEGRLSKPRTLALSQIHLPVPAAAADDGENIIAPASYLLSSEGQTLVKALFRSPVI